MHRLLSSKLVHGVLVEIKELEKEIVQLTVHMRSLQSIAFYDNKGKLVRGGEDAATEVDEYVVFERTLGPNTHWMYAGKIDPSEPYREASVAELLGTE